MLQALIHAHDLADWVAGNEPIVKRHNSSLVCRGPPAAACSAGQQEHDGHGTLVPLKLFSLNDYLGLASHPDVCAAASVTSERVREVPLLTHHC